MEEDNKDRLDSEYGYKEGRMKEDKDMNVDIEVQSCMKADVAELRCLLPPLGRQVSNASALPPLPYLAHNSVMQHVQTRQVSMTSAPC